MKLSHITQVNLQLNFGGGEVYTRMMIAALKRRGIHTTLIVHPKAKYWANLVGDLGCRLVTASTSQEILAAVSRGPSLVLTHTIFSAELAQEVRINQILVGVLHMPLHERFPSGLPYYNRLIAVSEYVKSTALAKGLNNVSGEPLYAIADIKPRDLAGSGLQSIKPASVYDWDQRKLRDRALCLLERSNFFDGRITKETKFIARPGMTLGIVSRLTPIKQFPQLFSLLAPILASRPEINLEIFGAGGYASVRDIRHALEPLGQQVRFWGYQGEVQSIYPKVDYLMAGLPEKEALGLNLIEAQLLGVGVLAVDAPPFTESVLDGVTGWFYTDPRIDQGRNFKILLDEILSGQRALNSSGRNQHLNKFSAEAFDSRLTRALEFKNAME
jgi:glycosyltransferase involved in cell wall biosynthesis